MIDGRWMATRPSELVAVCLRSAVSVLGGEEELCGQWVTREWDVSSIRSIPRSLLRDGYKAVYRKNCSSLRCKVAVDYTFDSCLSFTNTPYLVTRKRIAPERLLQAREHLPIASTQHLQHATPHSLSTLLLLVLRRLADRGKTDVAQLPVLRVEQATNRLHALSRRLRRVVLQHARTLLH